MIDYSDDPNIIQILYNPDETSPQQLLLSSGTPETPATVWAVDGPDVALLHLTAEQADAMAEALGDLTDDARAAGEILRWALLLVFALLLIGVMWTWHTSSFLLGMVTMETVSIAFLLVQEVCRTVAARREGVTR